MLCVVLFFADDARSSNESRRAAKSAGFSSTSAAAVDVSWACDFLSSIVVVDGVGSEVTAGASSSFFFTLSSIPTDGLMAASFFPLRFLLFFFFAMMRLECFACRLQAKKSSPLWRGGVVEAAQTQIFY
jgi:hypothetical protein